jgi:hypothetical protein
MNHVNGCFFRAAAGGTGAFAVASAIAGFLTPANADAQNGVVYGYRAESNDLSQWEIGTGTYTTAGTTLSRTVLKSSNANAAVNFTDPPRIRLVALSDSFFRYFTDEQNTSAPNATIEFIGIKFVGTAPYDGGFDFKGYSAGSGGAFSLQIPDNLATGGNKRGAGAIELMSYRTAAADVASGSNSLLIGNAAAQAAAADSIAIGRSAIIIAAATNSIAIGKITASNDVSQVIIGNGAYGDFTTGYAVAIGEAAYVFGDSTTAVGAGANAGAAYSSAFGASAYATAEYAVAIGQYAEANGVNSVSIGGTDGGTPTKAYNDSAIAIGRGATSGVNGSTTVDYTIAIGDAASATGNSGVAVGKGAIASGEASISMGWDAVASAYGTFAFGDGSVADADYAMAIGSSAFAGEVSATSVGHDSAVQAINGSAFGDNAFVATGADRGVAVGYLASARGVESVAIGDNAQIRGTGAIGIGDAAITGKSTGTNTGLGAIAIGDGALANSVTDSTKYGIAVGFGASAQGEKSLAAGYTASAEGLQSVVVGSASTLSTSDQAVAVGYGATGWGFRSVAIGNNAQASDTADSSIAIGDGVSAIGDYSIALGGGAYGDGLEAISIGSASSTGGDYAVSIGASSGASAAYSLALGYSAFAAAEYGICIGSDAQDYGVIGKESHAGYSGRAIQSGRLVLAASTADATPAKATSNDQATAAGTNNQLILQNNTVFTFTGKAVAREPATGNASSWDFKGTIKRGANAAATSLVGSSTAMVVTQDAAASAWAVGIAADTTNGGLSITVTGEAGKTIKWAFEIESLELTNF